MKIVITILFSLCFANAFAQKNNEAADTLQTLNTDSLTHEIEKSTASLDSSMKAYDRWAVEQASQRDSLSNIQSLNRFMAERREQERKQTQGFIVRGVLLGISLVLAITGFIRRRRLANKTKG